MISLTLFTRKLILKTQPSLPCIMENVGLNENPNAQIVGSLVVCLEIAIGKKEYRR